MEQGDIYQSRSTGSAYQYAGSYRGEHILYRPAGELSSSHVHCVSEEVLENRYVKVEPWFEVGKVYRVADVSGSPRPFTAKWIGKVNGKEACFGLITYRNGREGSLLLKREDLSKTYWIA